MAREKEIGKNLQPLTARRSLELGMLWLGRILALTLLAASPWYYGMVTWNAQMWLVPCVATIFVLAMGALGLGNSPGKIARKLLNPLSFTLVALLAIALLQTMVLPSSLWESIAPLAAFERRVEEKAKSFDLESLQVTSPLIELPASALPNEALNRPTEAPHTLSIHPLQTRASASVWGAAVAMLLACGVLFRGRLGNVLLLAVIGLTAMANTLLGLFQNLAWDDWTLLDSMRSTSFSTFISPNSAPQFIAMGIGAMAGILVWWNKKLRKKERSYQVRYPSVNVLARMARRLQDMLEEIDKFSIVLLFALCLLVVGSLGTFSRGGILSTMFAGLVTLGLTFSKGPDAWFRASGILIVVGFAVALLLSSLGIEQRVLGELDTINEESHQLSDVRFEIWKASIAEPAYWLAGCGLGTYHFGILPNFSELQAAWFYHAENIYVELFTELGVVGFLLGITGVVWLVVRLLQLRGNKRRNEVLYPAVVFAVSALGLHALVDFSLIIPGIFLPLAAIVGCFLTDGEFDVRKPSKPRDARQDALRRLKGETKGTVDEREEAEVPTERTKTLRVWSGGMALGFCILPLIAMGQGYGSLRGFGVAEKLERGVKQFEEIAAQVNSMDAVVAEWTELAASHYDHPEVLLQLARLQQKQIERKMLASTAWPAEVKNDQDLKDSLALPETISAAIRGGAEGRLAELKSLFEAEMPSIAALEGTAVSMQFALDACPLDWRASWGLLRSDTGRCSPEVRANNYARLSLTTSHHPRLTKAIGSNALWAREADVALVFLEPALKLTPLYWSKVIPLLDGLRTTEEVISMLPKQPLERTLIAQGVEKTAQRHPVATELLASADLAELLEVADNRREWLHVEWVAAYRSEPRYGIDALKKVVAWNPTDHTARFRLAKLYDSIDNFTLAKEEIIRALGYDAENKAYLRFLDQLEKRRAVLQFGISGPPQAPHIGGNTGLENN